MARHSGERPRERASGEPDLTRIVARINIGNEIGNDKDRESSEPNVSRDERKKKSGIVTANDRAVGKRVGDNENTGVAAGTEHTEIEAEIIIATRIATEIGRMQYEARLSTTQQN